MALPNDLSNIGSIANAIYNSIAANTTAITSIYVNAVIANGSTGTSSQVLTSNGTGTFWSTASAFPSGVSMLFVQTTAPVGWTKVTTHNNKALRVVSGTAGSGGSVGFTTAFASQGVTGTISSTTAGGSVGVSVGGSSFSGTVGATTLSIAQIPYHNHTLFYSATGLGGGGGSFVNGPTDLTGTNYTGDGGSHSHSFSGTTSAPSASGSFTGSSHNHTFSGTAIDLAVAYVDIIIATKD
jgi:hypothetical protein